MIRGGVEMRFFTPPAYPIVLEPLVERLPLLLSGIVLVTV